MGEFTATFENGWTSDASVVYQPKGTVRFMKNCQLISQDGNNFVIKDCMGNVKIFSINIPYSTDYLHFGHPPTPIGFISFPEDLVCCSTTSESETGGYGEIGLIKYLPYGEGIQPLTVSGEQNAGYVPLYHHADLKFSKQHRIEGIAYPENNLTKRFYFTDYNDEPKVFNIADPIFTTYFATNGLTTGTQYMVVEGVARHNGVDYGPGLATNIFTAVSAFYTNITGSSPTAKVIKYYPVELLSWTPDRTLGIMRFAGYGSGNVNCGSKVYFYRLKIADGSAITPWSYGSFPIHVTTLNSLTASPPYNTTYESFGVGGGTPTTLLNSNKSVKIKISGIDLRYSQIEMACAEYDQIIDTPRQIVIVARKDITGEEMILEHTGTTLGNLTLDDVSLFPASILKCKSITTTKLYNLIANITEREEIDYDTSAITVSAFRYYLPAIADGSFCYLWNNRKRLTFSSINDPIFADLYPYARFLVTSGDPNAYVEYPVASGTKYYNGQVFMADGTNTSYTKVGVSEVRPCVTKNKYTKTTNSSRTEDAVLIKNSTNFATFDYVEPAVHSHLASLWNNETYRWGLLFFDLKGNPYYVKWIADYAMPDANSWGGIMNFTAFAGEKVYSLGATGVKFGNIVLENELLDKISGFSIVRAERTRPRIITQGLVTQVVNASGTHRPAAWNPPGYSADPLIDSEYCFICPDKLIAFPLRNDISPGKMVEEAYWLSSKGDADGQGNTVLFNSSNSTDMINTRIIAATIADGLASTRTRTVTSTLDLNEGSGGNIGSSTFNNNISMGGSTPPAGNVCVGAAVVNLANFTSQGGKKTIFRLNQGFSYHGTGTSYSSNAIAGSADKKIMMNVVDPSGGYGAIEDTLYITTGHYQPINAVVRAETANGAGGCTFNNVEVFGGDAYICPIDHVYGLWDNAFVAPYGTYSYCWEFVCECNVNYSLRRGRKASNSDLYYTGATTGNRVVYTSADSVTNLESYSYNPGYSTEGQNRKYPALPKNFLNNNVYKTRIRFAGPKIINEINDSFRKFLIGDYHDLDVQPGQINKIAVSNGRVLVWQDLQASTVPVLERQILSGLSGAATTLGTGGVVDRSDPITGHGTQHQWSVIQTEFGFVWFDMNNKAFMVFDGAVGEMSQILGLKGYLGEAFLEAIGNSFAPGNEPDTPLLNSPTFIETGDRPLMGTGIIGVYDPKFKTTYMTFKFLRRKVTRGVDGESFIFADVASDFTIMYYHSKKMFIGQVDWFPAIAHNHNQIVLSVNNPKNLNKYYGENMANTAFEVGDVVNGGDGGEYICERTLTPEIPYSTPPNGTYFILINQVNQIQVLNQPAGFGFFTAIANPQYQYNRFDGRAVNNEIVLVVNPNTKNPFNVTNYEERVDSDVRFTDVEIDADGELVADNSIRPTDKNYKFFFDKIQANLPIKSNGKRIVKQYLRVRFIKKNWATDPRFVSTAVKTLRWIKFFFTERT